MRLAVMALALLAGCGPTPEELCDKIAGCGVENNNCEEDIDIFANDEDIDCLANSGTCAETRACLKNSESITVQSILEGDPGAQTASISITCGSVTCSKGADRSDYSDGDYESVTCVWTCANYDGQPGRYVSLSADTGVDGGCFEEGREYVSDGIGCE